LVQKIAETNGGTQGRTKKKHLKTTSTGTTKIQKDSKTEEALLKYAAF